METFGNKIQQNSATNFFCKICKRTCSSKYNLKSHFLSRAHVMETNSAKIQQNKSFEIYHCERCQKKYKTRSGLWKHKNKCIFEEDKSSELENNQIILKLLEQNANLQNKIMEISKDKSTIINNITNNNHFNLQVFLHEKCKDAINLMDFVNSLKLQIKDLELTGKIGYAEGISQIFINGLKELDLYKRPIHCSDSKREVFYVKDCNIWEKENKEKEKIKKAIQIISNKNIKQILDWQQQNPDCFNIESKKNDEFIKIVHSAMCGETKEEEDKNYEKIIKNVAKEVFIDKEK